MYKICFILLILSLFVQSYANDDSYFERNEAELYEEAVNFFDQKKYKQAIRLFYKIEDLYPFSYWAMKSKLLSGISNYELGDYSSAASIIDDYVNVYSNSEDLPYAYYLRILSYYMQINKVQLGQQNAYRTLELAAEYVNLFPNSEYTSEVKEKAELLTRHILMKEYSIGKFYLSRGEYLAAIKRFQDIIKNEDFSYFSQSVSNLVVAYSALGLDLEVEQYKDMLAKVQGVN